MMGNGVHARSVYVQLKQPVISESGKNIFTGLCRAVCVCVCAGYIFYAVGACMRACVCFHWVGRVIRVLLKS